MVKDKLIVALDFHTKEDALALVDKLGDSVVFYKVGMELFYRVDSSIIEELKKRNKKIFLDFLKEKSGTLAPFCINLLFVFILISSDFYKYFVICLFKFLS